MDKEMNRLGMMVDVSHISDRALLDVLKYSTAPVIASHSCCKTLCDHKRNLSDELIKKLAKNDGVMQINFYSGFLSQAFKDSHDAEWENFIPKIKELHQKHRDNPGEYWRNLFGLWRESSPESVDISVVIDHIDHVVKLVGIDHVGLGSDFDGASAFPKGLENASGYPLITYHLLTRGYSEEDIRKILGGNILRLFKEVEEAAVD